MIEIKADQMIISVADYNLFKEQREWFDKEKAEHIKENLVCTAHLGFFSHDPSYHWEKEDTVYKERYEKEYNNKFKSMSVLDFIKWKRR